MRRTIASVPVAAGVFAAAMAASLAGAPAQEAAERLAEREAVAQAAARFGCKATRLDRLSTPHEGVWQARCRDSRILWLHRVDGAWTVKPIG